MKQKLQIALFVGVMLSGVLNTPLQAATAQNPQGQASKKQCCRRARILKQPKAGGQDSHQEIAGQVSQSQRC